MTYGWEVSCSKSIIDFFRGKLVGLELTARKNLSDSPAVIRPSGRNHLFKGRIIPARGNKVNFVSKAN